MAIGIFDVDKQMAFYGAYHSNKINILVHILFVPILMWTGVSMGSHIPTPEWLQVYPGLIAAALNGGTVPGWFFHHRFNEYMVWDLNVASVIMVLYWVYYFILEPVGALLYAPQIALSTLTAVSYASSGKDSLTRSTALHIVSWIAQFLSHGIAEGRAPALLDNLLGALVLAPFFVHLEILFSLGFKPAMHKRLQNNVGKEIVKVRSVEGEKKRAKAAKSL